MSTQSHRSGVRGYRRRKVALNLDLNNAPPGDNRDQEGTSTQVATRNMQPRQHGNSVPPAMIDVEAIDDDVIESSPRAFAAAKNNRRSRARTIVDVEAEDWSRVAGNQKRRRASPNQTIINCDLYINLESGGSSMVENAEQPPPPPKEPTFTCPICMGPLAEEMSTKCGHIFCKACIKAAITAQGKCPTCRKRVTAKELIRVFLPATS